jgi:hypothetical protein
MVVNMVVMGNIWPDHCFFHELLYQVYYQPRKDKSKS